MELTNKQSAIIDKAVEMLSPYNKEDICYGNYYFESVDEDGDTIGDQDFQDYDVCDKKECVNEQRANIEIAYPNLKFQLVYTDNNGDHEHFERCTNCGRPLNEFLTWVADEIEYHLDNTTSLEDITKSYNAFEICGCLYSLKWSCDYDMSYHAKTFHYDEGVKRQQDFIKKMIKYSKHIIKTLSRKVSASS